MKGRLLLIKVKKRGNKFLVFGLPERIRTFGLQSRSLTRYPAVPRVEITLLINPKKYLQSLPLGRRRDKDVPFEL